MGLLIRPLILLVFVALSEVAFLWDFPSHEKNSQCNGKKIPWDFIKKSGIKIPKKSHGIEKSRDFREIPKKSQRWKNVQKWKKNKKSEKNLKIKNQRKITTVDIPLCCFFRRLFRDLKFLRHFHKTYRWIPATVPEIFFRGFFQFWTVFKNFVATCSFFILEFFGKSKIF